MQELLMFGDKLTIAWSLFLETLLKLNKIIFMSETLIQLFTSILLMLVAGLGWLYKTEKEKRIHIERQLSDKKYEVYIKLMSIFTDLMKNLKLKKEYNEKKMTVEMYDIQKELLIFACDDVLKAFYKWQKESQNKKNLFYLAKLIIEVRKDMGFPKTKITTEDYLQSLLTSKEEFNKLKEDGYFIE